MARIAMIKERPSKLKWSSGISPVMMSQMPNRIIPMLFVSLNLLILLPSFFYFSLEHNEPQKFLIRICLPPIFSCFSIVLTGLFSDQHDEHAANGKHAGCEIDPGLGKTAAFHRYFL